MKEAGALKRVPPAVSGGHGDGEATDFATLLRQEYAVAIFQARSEVRVYRIFSRVLPLIVVGAAVAGCSTSQDIVVNPANVGRSFRSAFLVAHGDKSSDVDAAIQRELFRRGITVAAGPEGKQPEASEVIVKYNDEWSWDMSMYLKALDINVYDAKSGSLLASAGWKNSALHGFYSLDTVAKDLIGGIFRKLGVKGPGT